MNELMQGVENVGVSTIILALVCNIPCKANDTAYGHYNRLGVKVDYVRWIEWSYVDGRYVRTDD